MSEVKDFGVLVSLDELLDTRLGTLNLIDPKATYDMLIEGNYFKRDMDNWEDLTHGKISNSAFKERLSVRDVDILKGSKLTALAPYLKELLTNVLKSKVSDPTIGNPVLYLNTHPYINLSEFEREAIKVAVEFHCCPLGVPLVLMNEPLQLISPALLLSKMDFFFVYEFEQWRELQKENLLITKMQFMNIGAPRLFINDRPKEEDLLIDGENPISPWNAAELFLFEYFQLDLMDIKFFSMVLP